MTGLRRIPVADRLWAKVDRSDDCWEWTGSKVNGYGQLTIGGHDGRLVRAHRVAFSITRGRIPDGLQLDHLCRNRGCVNPAHLEPVTNRENGLRGISPAAVNARKTHCLRGHEFNDANTYFTSHGYRYCRPCMQIRKKGYRRAKREALRAAA